MNSGSPLHLKLFLLILCASAISLMFYILSQHRPLLNWQSDEYYHQPRKVENVEALDKAKPCGTQIFENPQIRQDDPDLLSYIREFHLTPPSERPYALTLPAEQDPSQFKDLIRRIFRNKTTPGFFIEAGANDGEFISNTLQLERQYNWSGLLIEPNIFMLTKLRLKFRKAWITGACLSLEGYPQKVRFLHPLGGELWRPGLGIVQHTADVAAPLRDINQFVYAGPAECFPLYSILLALNQTVIDYFSLDVEGIELRILKAIPFELLQIKVFSIEANQIPEGEQVLREFLEGKGYKILGKRVLDVELFAIHKDFLHEFF